jgi:hypothetical protein
MASATTTAGIISLSTGGGRPFLIFGGFGAMVKRGYIDRVDLELWGYPVTREF